MHEIGHEWFGGSFSSAKSKCCLTLLGLRASAHKAEHQVSQTGTRERERDRRMQTTEILKSGGEKYISKAGQI